MKQLDLHRDLAAKYCTGGGFKGDYEAYEDACNDCGGYDWDHLAKQLPSYTDDVSTVTEQTTWAKKMKDDSKLDPEKVKLLNTSHAPVA